MSIKDGAILLVEIGRWYKENRKSEDGDEIIALHSHILPSEDDSSSNETASLQTRQMIRRKVGLLTKCLFMRSQM